MEKEIWSASAARSPSTDDCKVSMLFDRPKAIA